MESKRAVAPRRRGLFSAIVLGVLGAASPWLMGTRATNLQWWWLVVATILGLGLVNLFAYWARRQKPRLPRAGWFIFFVLAATLAWWWFVPLPGFATAFAEEHWRFMLQRQPEGVLEVPRSLRLATALAMLVAGLIAFEVSNSRRNCAIIALGVAVGGVSAALYSLAQKYGLVWTPRWLLAGRGGPDRFDGPYFHYTVAASALNVAWPLLCFWRASKPGIVVLKFGLTIGLLVLCMPLWPAESCHALSVALFVAGGGYLLLARRKPIGGPLVFKATVAVLLALGAVQIGSVVYISRNYNDHWSGAEATALSAPDRDQAVRAKAWTRGDRLVASNTPARPVAWLTALRMASDHPVVGPGPGVWPRVSVLYSNDPLVNTFYHHRQFAHHDLLQTAAQSGVFIALLLAAVWFWALNNITLNLSGRVELGVFLSLLGLILQSMWHFPLQVPGMQLWAALLLGVAIATPSRVRPVNSERLHSKRAGERSEVAG